MLQINFLKKEPSAVYFFLGESTDTRLRAKDAGEERRDQSYKGTGVKINHMSIFHFISACAHKLSV